MIKGGSFTFYFATRFSTAVIIEIYSSLMAFALMAFFPLFLP